LYERTHRCSRKIKKLEILKYIVMGKPNGLASRMKEYYQDAYNIKLPKRSNVIIRLDGKSFGKYTKGLETPFDKDFAEDMNMTAKYLAENIQGCKFAYVQSDEISLLLTDYDTFETSAWFDNKLQKIVSVTASMATSEFNRRRLMRAVQKETFGVPIQTTIECFRMGEFDSRVFIIPDAEEVVNYFLWRQQDATRNSISMSGQKYFSHRDLQNKSTSEVQDMLFNEFGINWNDYPVRFRRGGCFKKENYLIIDSVESGFEKRWVYFDPPIFSKDRDFILETFKLEE